MGTRKTIRFYDNPRDTKALDALSDYKNYGFDNENQMVVTALYEFVEHHTTPQMSYSPNELADLIAERLKGSLNVTVETRTTETNNTSSSTMELDTTNSTADDDTFAMASNFIDMLQEEQHEDKKQKSRYNYKSFKQLVYIYSTYVL